MTKRHMKYSCIFINTGNIEFLGFFNHWRLIKSLLIEFIYFAIMFYSFLFNDSSNFILKIPWEKDESVKGMPTHEGLMCYLANIFSYS